MGKWSLIDVYVLVLCMVAFTFRIVSAQGSKLLGPEFYAIDILVKPLSGLYAFLVAVLSSLVLGNVTIISHRAARQNDIDDHAAATSPVVDQGMTTVDVCAPASSIGGVDTAVEKPSAQ